MTTKEKFIQFLIDRGMFHSQAELVFEQAKPKFEIDNYSMTWDRPSEEYPPAVYAAGFSILQIAALEWIHDNAPGAWFKPLFERKI